MDMGAAFLGLGNTAAAVAEGQATFSSSNLQHRQTHHA